MVSVVRSHLSPNEPPKLLSIVKIFRRLPGVISDAPKLSNHELYAAVDKGGFHGADKREFLFEGLLSSEARPECDALCS